MIEKWVKSKLKEYKRLADSRWHKSETTYYASYIDEYDDIKLRITLGTKECKEVPDSLFWHSTGIVAPVPGKQEFEYMVKYTNEVYVYVNGWDKLISTLESDLKKYNRKMMKALQKNVERAIDSLPG